MIFNDGDVYERMNIDAGLAVFELEIILRMKNGYVTFLKMIIMVLFGLVPKK